MIYTTFRIECVQNWQFVLLRVRNNIVCYKVFQTDMFCENVVAFMLALNTFESSHINLLDNQPCFQARRNMALG